MGGGVRAEKFRPLPPRRCLRPTRGEHMASPGRTLVVPVANPGRSSGNPFEYTPPDDHPLNHGYWESTAAINPEGNRNSPPTPPPRLPATTSASGGGATRGQEDVHRGLLSRRPPHPLNRPTTRARRRILSSSFLHSQKPRSGCPICWPSRERPRVARPF
jgi:hypothetical protein